MSTVAERYKKWKAEQTKQTEENNDENQEEKSDLSERYRQWNAKKVATDIYNRTNAWLGSTGDFINGYNERYGGDNSSWMADAGDYYNNALASIGDFDTEADAILDLLNRYGEYYDEDFKKNITDALNGNRESYGYALKGAEAYRDYYGQWGSQDEYDLWQESVKRDEGYAAYDSEAGTAKIDRLKYYADKKAELEAIISAPEGSVSGEERLKAHTALKVLYDEYKKEFGISSGSSVLSDGGTGSWMVNEAESPTAIDFNKLLSDEKDFHKRASDYQAYLKITEQPNYEAVIAKAKNKPIDFGKVLDTKHTNNRITVAEFWNKDGVNTDGMTMYTPSQEAYVLPLMMNYREQTIYNWYFGNEEYDKAEAYYQSIKGELEDRAHGTAMYNVQQQAIEHPVWTSIQSVGRNVFFTPAEAVTDAAKLVGGSLAGKEDVKLDRNQMADLVQAARGTVASDIESDFGRLLYNTGMSGADSLLSGLTLGGAAAPALALTAASSFVNEGIDRGLSDKQIIFGAIAAGTFEYIFEKWSLGNLDSMKDSVISMGKGAIKDVARNIANSAVVNASEEAFTEIANILYDTIATGDLSNYEVMVQEYVDEGLSREDAEKKAKENLWSQVLEATASGALMGVGFGAAGSAMGMYNNLQQTIQAGKSYKNAYGVDGVKALASQASQYNQKLSTKLQSKLDKGKNISNYRVGRLVTTLGQSTIQTAFENATGSSKAAAALTNIVMGKEIGKSEASEILGNEKALAALNEMLGTNITKDTDIKSMRKQVKDAVISQTDAAIDGLDESLRDSVRSLVQGDLVSNKKIEAVIANKKAREILSLRTGIQITKDTSVREVKEAVTEMANDHTRGKTALVLAASLNMSANGAKAVARIVENGSGDVSHIVQAFNAVYQAGKQGKTISEAKNPYLSELSLAEKKAAYEYGVMDAMVERSETKKTETKKAEAETKKEAPKQELSKESKKLATGEVVTPVKTLNKEQTRVVEGGKKFGVEVIIADIKSKTGENVDAMFDGKRLYINPNPNSGSPAIQLLKHEMTHFPEKRTPIDFATFVAEATKSKAFKEWRNEKGYASSEAYVNQIIANYKIAGQNLTPSEAQAEMVANFVADKLFGDEKGFDRFVNGLDQNQRKTLGGYVRSFIDWVKAKLGKMSEIELLEKRYSKLVSKSLQGFDSGAFVEETKSSSYNYQYIQDHKVKLAEKYSSSAAIDLDTLQKRYDAAIRIWEKLGGQLDSKFLNEWNSKVGKDRAFTVFKAQSGYKYNVELSSMCKKGVPLFEAIDTIVKEEAMKELKVDKLGKAEKEILYDLLKSDGFDIPCAICYVEQARQREGDIIDAFLNGNGDGKVGWNQVLHEVEGKMKAAGIEYKFPALDRSVGTDKYVPTTVKMTETEQNAFYEALKEIANREIKRYNESRAADKKFKPRKLVTSLTPAGINDTFKGNISSDLKIFKVLFQNPDSRFTIDSDLLYSSATTHNLAYSHNALYSLFNQQGGVSGYKTKQGNVVYWGDILDKKWEASKLRKEGGIRYQSNSDSQMYTLLDQVQMFVDLTAKGYYLQSYTKVLSYLKLLGLSKGKINASLIPSVVVYRNADGTVDWARTQENAGLDENGQPIYDDIEGINHNEAFMLIEDAEYSKSVGGVCIGYSDNHIRALLDDSRIQLIIGFHDKTNNPDKRYRGARYSKNYNGINEAVDAEGKTVHIGFNQFIRQAEGMFTKVGESFEGTTTHNGKTYEANDIPRLAADLYLEMCEKKGYTPAYNIEGIVDHKNYYKLLADFSLYDSEGNYAPHQKVEYNMPDQVPYIDENGHKRYMSSERYIRNELQKELQVRDDIAEKLADKSEAGLIPRFVKAVNGEQVVEADETSYSYTPQKDVDNYTEEQYNSFGWVRANNVINAGYWRNFTENFARAVTGNGHYPKTQKGEYMIDVYDVYDNSGTTDVIVFANGTIENPNVTKIVKIDSNNSTDIEYERREILEAERRGIQQKAGEFFRFYNKADFIGKRWQQGVSANENRDSSRLNAKRSASEIKANPIVEFRVNEDKGTVTTIYRNGEVEETSYSYTPSERDTKYLDAVNNGDTETAQRMVDGAAKEAGYDSPKLYHGTTAFGFTEFDFAKADDHISVFATTDEGVAGTYTSKNPKTSISERADITPEELENASDKQILSYLRKYVSKDFRLMSTVGRTESARDTIGEAKDKLTDFIDENSERIDGRKGKILQKMVSAIETMQEANTYKSFYDAYTVYESAIWNLKWEDNALLQDIRPLIVEDLSQSYAILVTTLNDGTVAFTDGDRVLYRNRAINELRPKLFSGVYKLYGKVGRSFVIEGNGANWNQLDGRKIGRYGPVTTRDVVEYASQKGYDSVTFKNIVDKGDISEGVGESTVYAFLRQGALKSADPVTYDDNGNVIPLSERFNAEENDIRYSYTPKEERNAELLKQYEDGNITREEYLKMVSDKKSDDDPISLINRDSESLNTTPELKRKKREGTGDEERKTYGSLQVSSIFDQTFKDEVKSDTFIKNYATVTNEETLRAAATELDEGGEDKVKQWLALKPNRASAVDIAMGIIMMDRYQRVGDYESQITVAEKLAEMGTESGRAVQIFSILRRFDPAAMLAYAQRSMDKAYEDLVKTKSAAWLEKHADQLRLTEDDIEFIYNHTVVAAGMPDGRSKDIMISQIAQRLQDKLPPERGQSLRALQRISMLLNPKTIGRNILGNVVITPVHWVSDWIGTPLDKMLSIASKVRTKSGVADFGENVKAFGRGFVESYEDLVNKVNTQANLDRFEISRSGAKSFYEHGKLQSLAKMMNAMDRLTSFTLAAGDRPFYEYWFVRSINSQMKANKVDMPTEDMVAIATQEALERTWQDVNMATKFATGLKKVLNLVSVGNLLARKETGGYGLGDVLIKFTKTPANLAKAIYDFSPAGFASASADAVKFVKAVKSGKSVAIAQRNFVKSFSNAAAGTMLYVIAFALYNSGRLVGASDEDKDVAAFEKWVQGVPAYSVKGFNGKWYSYEWMQPVGAVPAIIADYMQNKEADMSTIASIEDAFKTGGTILYNQSFLQSIQKLFTADNIWEGLRETLYSDPSAFVPQVMSQFATLFDDRRRVTFDKTNPLKSSLNAIMYKIPGLRNKLQTDYDVFGRPVPNSQNNVFDAFINPANTYVDTSDEVTNHVYALYKELGSKAMIPAKAPYSITVGDKKVNLTPEQRAEYQVTMGTVAYKIIEGLLESELYNSYTTEEQEVIIKDVYAYANKVALGNYDAEYTFEMARKDNKYITRAEYDKMSSEEKHEAYRRGVLSGYSSILDTDEDGVIAYYENRAVNTAVTDALEYYDVDKAKELIEIAKANVPRYSNDPDEDIKSMMTRIKSNVTSIWKYQYQIAYYENDTDRMNQIRQMLIALGLYGKSSDVRKTLNEWLEESERAKE